jgi:hypothetical protein
MLANRHADTTPTRHLRSRHGAMSPTWSVSCWRHGADMSACLSFWGGKIPDTTPTLPAKEPGVQWRSRVPPVDISSGTNQQGGAAVLALLGLGRAWGRGRAADA